jgi:hypothetical protein
MNATLGLDVTIGSGCVLAEAATVGPLALRVPLDRFFLLPFTVQFPSNFARLADQSSVPFLRSPIP